jgi:disulfide bond formation protein DsbB
MLSHLSTRLIFAGIFVFCCGLMAVGYYMQFALEMEPCPLCMTQRVFIVLSGLIALIACLHNPSGSATAVYGGLIGLSATLGASFSIRQLYLQSLPPDLAPACGPSVSYILETFPLNKALQIMLKGDGNCAEVLWTFLGISIPGWTLVAFAMTLCTAIYVIVRGLHDRHH